MSPGSRSNASSASAASNYDGEHWETARAYYQRALPLKPDDPDILERLFHVNNQLRRAADARQVLEQLRQVRAGAPQLELYELEVNEVRTADDVLRLLGEVEHVVRKYPQDAAVAERAAGIFANLITFMASLEKQYRQQLRKTERSLQELPSYQVNWPEVHGYLRDVRGRLAKLAAPPTAVSAWRRSIGTAAPCINCGRTSSRTSSAAGSWPGELI